MWVAAALAVAACDAEQPPFARCRESAATGAAVVSALSCERGDVAAAIEAAQDGDTVAIPAGTCSWSENLTIEGKAITLQGAGMDQTVIVDQVPKVSYGAPVQVLTYITPRDGLSRITGITFQGGDQEDIYNSGMVAVWGASRRFRLDGSRFRLTESSGLIINGSVLGVIDHNVFHVDNWSFGIYIHHANWNETGDFGDASWAEPTYLGTDQAMFLEDNLFTTAGFGIATDGWMGSRVVIRRNTSVNASFQNHGTETGGRWRGQRSFELYDNDITYDNPSVWNGAFGIRSGTGVLFGNRMHVSGGAYVTFLASLTCLRSIERARPYPTWELCDGSNVWDGNTDEYGYPCLDQPGRGAGARLDGFEPSPVGYTAQALEPVYAWDNTINDVVAPLISHAEWSVVRANRDYFNEPMPGYQPYVYPHPLVSGVEPPPSDPDPGSGDAPPCTGADCPCGP